MDRIVPLLVVAAAVAGLALGIEPVPTWFYALLWWPYVVAVDTWTRRRTGRSLIRDDPAGFARLALVSVAWWTLFEAINLRLGNWYYVMSPAGRVSRWTLGVVAFATVLPGTLVTVRALDALGRPGSLRVAPLRWSRGHDRASVAVGLVFLLLPLLWPDLFFPLTWGSFILLLAPLNRRFARESFLRDLMRGDATGLGRTLLAGLVCGGVWEAGNYWARSRWIYTVPGFEELKLFEMPLLGFLGFPPFAVECVAFVRALETARERLASWPSAWRAAAGWGAGLAAAGLTALVFVVSEPIVNDSFDVAVAELRVLPEDSRRRLDAAGLHRVDSLARALRGEGGVERWSARTGLPAAELRTIRGLVALLRHRGLGEERALQLRELGIETLADLARWSPERLAAALRAQRPRHPDPFLERRARVWLRGLGDPRRPKPGRRHIDHQEHPRSTRLERELLRRMSRAPERARRPP